MARRMAVPNVETLGYYRPSLRDDGFRILVTLDWKVRAPFRTSVALSVTPHSAQASIRDSDFHFGIFSDNIPNGDLPAPDVCRAPQFIATLSKGSTVGSRVRQRR